MDSKVHVTTTKSRPVFGAIEGGGTKFNCAVGKGPDEIVAHHRIATTDPDTTLQQVIDFFRGHPIAALGIGMFGPLELRKGPDQGTLLATPKPGWTRIAVKRILEDALHVPVVVDTDVNAAALGEARWGAARDLDVVLYLTVGTGVGGGILVHGRPLHGLLHPELGHMLLPALRDASGQIDTFPGVCPFHGRCFEGLVSGPSLAARTGRRGEDLAPDDPALILAARYVGLGLANAVMALSPQRIIVGGGVMGRSDLLAVVRRSMHDALGGYVARPELDLAHVDTYVVAPMLETRAGIAGAFGLAELADKEA